jgi:hypothetical protein
MRFWQPELDMPSEEGRRAKGEYEDLLDLWFND